MDPLALVRHVVAQAQTAGKASVDLVSSIVKQAREETLPWVMELIDPWTSSPIDLPETKPPRELAAPKSRFMKVNGVDLHYFEQGVASPTQPTIFCWHGFNGSVFNWRYMLDLAEASNSNRHVVAFDRPPFGLSERPTAVAPDGTNPYSSQGSIELARGLLQGLGTSRAIHVGHSAGASLALQYALAHPDEVDALIFVSPAVSVSQNNMPRDAGALLRTLYMRLLLGNDRAGLRFVQKRILKSYKTVREGGGTGRHDDSRVTEEDIYYYLLPAAAANWDIGALQSFRAFSMNTRNTIDFDALKVPVLVIEGLQDKATTPAFVNRLVTRLRERPEGSTKYIEMDNCGHLPMEEHPAKTLAYVDEFLEELGHGTLGTPFFKAAGP